MADTHNLPESLRRLIDAWRNAGDSRDEIFERLDELDLLAHEDRLKLVKFVESTG